MSLIPLNWRARAARLHVYFREGLNLNNELKQLIFVGAALKILGLPLWTLALITPFVIVYLILSGYWFLRHGWKRHNSEVELMDAWQPIENWKLWVWTALLSKLGVDMTQYDPKHLPPQVLAVLESTKTGHEVAQVPEIIWVRHISATPTIR